MMHVCVCVCALSRVWLSVTPWTICGSYVHGLLSPCPAKFLCPWASQARILKWDAISFSANDA